VNSSQSLVVVVTIELDVGLMSLSHLCHHGVNIGHTLVASSHGLRGEVSVAAGSIPVLKELGGEGDGDVEVFSDTLEKISGDPKLVTHGNAFNWAYLVFPLAWHYLSIGTRNFDASIEAGSVVSISNDSTEAVVGANRAIEGSLSSRVSVVRPADRPSGELSLGADESVLLFDAEPWLFMSALVEDSLGMDSEVGVGGDELLAASVGPLVSLSEDDLVATLSEGISKAGDGLHDDF